MNFNKNIQYGILFSLYLARAGRATVRDAAANLDLSKSLLEQVARKMRLGGVVTSVRGPGGGYELSSEATVTSVILCFEDIGFLPVRDAKRYVKGQPEERALFNYTWGLNSVVTKLLNRKVSWIMKELVANEMALLNKLNVKGLEN